MYKSKKNTFNISASTFIPTLSKNKLETNNILSKKTDSNNFNILASTFTPNISKNKKTNTQNTQNKKTNTNTPSKNTQNKKTNTNTPSKSNQNNKIDTTTKKTDTPSLINKKTNTPNNEKKTKELTINKKLIELDYLFEDYPASSEDLEKICILMKELDYPYNGLIYFHKLPFDIYLNQNGIVDLKFIVDIPYIIKHAIAGDIDINWNNFLSKLTMCTHDFSNRDLNLVKIKHVDKMIDVSKMGFIDKRFEHAIITIQRLIRYNKKHQKPNEYMENKKWVDTFEKEHHCREKHWKTYGIHMNTLDDIKNIKIMEDGETNILMWNSHLIQSYIHNYMCDSNDECNIIYNINYLMGINLHVLRKNKYTDIRNLIKGKVTYDYAKKFNLMKSYYLENKMNLWRCNDIDILKYMKIGGGTNDDTYYENVVFNELIHYQYDIAEKICKVLDVSTHEYGRKILSDFTKIDINKLSIDMLKHWFNLIVIWTLKDVVTGKIENEHIDTELKTDIKEKTLHRFITGIVAEDTIKEYKKIVEYLKKILNKYQKLIINKKKIYAQPFNYYAPTINMITL